MVKFNFGNITEIAVCIFFSEIFENIDFQTKKIDVSKLSRNAIELNLMRGKYVFGKKTLIRKEKDINGDDVSVSLTLKSTKSTLDFFKDFQQHAEHHEKLFEIFDSLNASSFSRNLYVSRSSPYKEIHYILDSIRDLIANGTSDTIDVELLCSGMDSGKKEPPDKITSSFDFVPKADIVIDLEAYETKTKKKYPKKQSKFSIKGNSTTVESTGASSAISLLYKLADARKDFFVENFQPSLSVSGEKKKTFIAEFLTNLHRLGKVKCKKSNVSRYFQGLISGSDNSTYFKVLEKVRTVDMKHAIDRINKSTSTFIVQEGSAIQIKMEEGGKDIILFTVYFTLSKKYVGADISINTTFMS